jgi:hypothetical protein
MSNSRDLGLNHGAGKGDADRSDRAKFVKGLENVSNLNPADRTGYKRIGLGRYRKVFGTPAQPIVSEHRTSHDELFPP